MSALPAALRRWRQKLAIFPEDLAAPLGHLVARLAPAFDALSRRESAADGDVDGYEGIANRGHYERLLSTEWAVNHAAPIEFLRRAANGEHLFLNLVRKRPAAPRGMLALFDAGPDQLGAPRIAQLAVLVLLAELAERRSESFGWQMVHHLGEPLFTTVDASSVQAFLQARTALRSSESALSDWRTRFPEQNPWLVGSRRLAAVAGDGVSRVEVLERVAHGPGVLEVDVKAVEGPPRQIELQLPGIAVSVRLLRDPFASTSVIAPERAPRLDSGLLLSSSGNRVFYRDTKGVRALMIPNSPRQKIGRPKSYSEPKGTTIVAVGRHAKRTVLLGVARGVAALWATEPIRRDVSQELFGPGPVLEPGTDLWPLIVFPGELCAVFVAGDRSLWRVELGSKECVHLADGVHAVAPRATGGGLVAVESHTDDSGRRAPALLDVQCWFARRVFEPPEFDTAWLRVPNVIDRNWALAFDESPGAYRIEARKYDRPVEPGLNVTLRPPSDAKVVGVDWAGEGKSGLGLYLLSNDGRELFVMGRGRSRTLVRSTSPLTQVALASASGVVAYTSADGELGFVERSGRTLWLGRMESS